MLKKHTHNKACTHTQCAKGGNYRKDLLFVLFYKTLLQHKAKEQNSVCLTTEFSLRKLWTSGVKTNIYTNIFIYHLFDKVHFGDKRFLAEVGTIKRTLLLGKMCLEDFSTILFQGS